MVDADGVAAIAEQTGFAVSKLRVAELVQRTFRRSGGGGGVFVQL